MDRRTERTRNLIINSLSELMKNKEYQNITVENIINKANVGRSTFYENFENKDEVFGEILNSLIYHVFSEVQHKYGHAFQKILKKKSLICLFILGTTKANLKLICLENLLMSFIQKLAKKLQIFAMKNLLTQIKFLTN